MLRVSFGAGFDLVCVGGFCLFTSFLLSNRQEAEEQNLEYPKPIVNFLKYLEFFEFCDDG